MKLNPQQSIYVGDHPHRDIDAANEINMITVQICKKGKYQDLKGKTSPDYRLESYQQLWEALQQDFQLNYGL